MSFFTQIRTWWNAIAHRENVQQQVEAEIEFHIGARTADLIRDGMPEEEARQRARAEVGRADTQNEKYRNAIGLRIFDEIGGDLRYGLRALFRNPGFTVIVILSLAVGIGATTAMFSLIYAVLLHPFPYAGADRIMNPVLMNEQDPSQLRWFALWRPQFAEFEKAQCIESLLGFRNKSEVLSGSSLPEDVQAVYLTENAERFFGVHPLLGRMIEPSDAAAGGQPVAVLNYRFWQRHFQGARDVIGKTLELNHIAYTIVGVMPRSFAFNDTTGVGDVYLPAGTLEGTPAAMRFFIPWVKLKRDVTAEAANAQLNALVHSFARQDPQVYPKNFQLALQPIVVPYARSTGRGLYLLLAGVLLLLLIGCANCSILLLARGAAREHELIMRSALGASRWRTIRQLMVEALVISFTGAALGVAASWWLAELPLHLAPQSFPAESIIRVNFPILIFSVVVAIGCGILFGLAPALCLSRTGSRLATQSATHRIVGQHGYGKLNVLIGAQAAFTLLLMATGAMTIGAFLRVTHSPLGYDPHHVLNAGIMTHFNDPAEWAGLKSRTSRAAYFEQIRRQMASVPGVLSVGISIDVSPPRGGEEQRIEALGQGAEQEQDARVQEVGRNFFTTLQIPIHAGRIWDKAEGRRCDGIAVINLALAQRLAPLGSAVGMQIRIPSLVSHAPLVAASPASSGWRTIVGVVGNIPNDGLGRPVLPAVYVPYATLLPPYAQFNIRTRGTPLSYMHVLRSAVAAVSPDQQISRGADTLESLLATDPQWSRQRLFSVLFGCFSAMALLLALVGLFSVVSFGVARRTTEFGVRMALGAPRRHIVWAAVRAALLSATLGMAFGVAIDLFLRGILSNWMKNQLSGFGGLIAVILLFALCTVTACLMPASRAVLIDPVDALRNE